MTFNELIRKVAEKNGMLFTAKGSTKADHGKTLERTESIIRDALKLSSDAAFNGLGAPVWPGIGRLVTTKMRSTGKTPSGTVWTKPGRVKLALKPSYRKIR